MSGAPDGYALRAACDGDARAIPAIERASARLFAPWGLDVLFAGTTTPVEIAREASDRGDLIVAAHVESAQVVGFAMLSRVDWHANLDELHVDPAHGRRGVGRALLEAACERARESGRGRVTLATMREVPFNAPWYLRSGFRELEERELGPGLRAMFGRELAGGYPIAERVILARDLR